MVIQVESGIYKQSWGEQSQVGVISRLRSLTFAYLKNWPIVLGGSKSPRTDVHSEFNGNGLAPSRRRRESPAVRNVPGRLLSGNQVLSVEHSRITDAALRIDDYFHGKWTAHIRSILVLVWLRRLRRFHPVRARTIHSLIGCDAGRLDCRVIVLGRDPYH